MLEEKFWEIAAEIIKRAEEIKPSQQAKRDVLKKYKISGTKLDRIYTKIFYGVMRYQGILDDIIKKLLKVGNINILDPWLRASLRLTLFEILFDRLSSKKKESLKKQIFNWLRNSTHPAVAIYYSKVYKEIVNNKRKFKESIDKEVLTLLLPKWFINKIKEILKNEEEIRKLAEYFKKVPLISIRVNILRAKPSEVKSIIEKKYDKKVKYGKYLKEILKFEGPFNFDDCDLWREGKIIVQEEAAALASIFLNPKPNQIIVDMCAAPGGKTEHIAELMNLKGKIYAFDINPIRIKRMKELLKRTGTIDIVEIFKFDARKASEKIGTNIADKVLLDAPCTSSGTIHKNPELRWRLKEENIKKAVKLQKALLEEAAKLVKPKGEILYCTCSLFKEENEDIIDWFLKNHKNFELIPLPSNYGSRGLISGTIRFWPHREDSIGFFYAKLRRKY